MCPLLSLACSVSARYTKRRASCDAMSRPAAAAAAPVALPLLLLASSLEVPPPAPAPGSSAGPPVAGEAPGMEAEATGARA